VAKRFNILKITNGISVSIGGGMSLAQAYVKKELSDLASLMVPNDQLERLRKSPGRFRDI